MTAETELIVATTAHQTLMRPIATPKELISYHGDMIKIIHEALKKDTDYGTIPGTGKPTLYKAGAERINIAFGTRPEYLLIEKEIDHNREVAWRKEKKVWNNKFKGDKSFRIESIEGSSIGLYRYVYKCRIKKQDGTIIAEGDGACSTLETKYVDRPRDCENVVCKMAQKRAFLAATLHAFGLSDQFTQDLEDYYQPPARSEKQHNNEPPSPPVFNKSNESHLDKLSASLTDKKIDPQFHIEIANAMDGLLMTPDNLLDVISKITS